MDGCMVWDGLLRAPSVPINTCSMKWFKHCSCTPSAFFISPVLTLQLNNKTISGKVYGSDLEISLVLYLSHRSSHKAVGEGVTLNARSSLKKISLVNRSVHTFPV